MADILTELRLPICPLVLPRLTDNLTNLHYWRITISSFQDFRRTISALAALQLLDLSNLKWSDYLDEAHAIVRGPSGTQPHELRVEAQRSWLHDPRTSRLLSWMAQSGAVRSLAQARLEYMMVLDEVVLLETVPVIKAAHGSLRRLSLSFGPDVNMLSCEPSFPLVEVANTLTSCTHTL